MSKVMWEFLEGRVYVQPRVSEKARAEGVYKVSLKEQVENKSNFFFSINV